MRSTAPSVAASAGRRRRSLRCELSARAGGARRADALSISRRASSSGAPGSVSYALIGADYLHLENLTAADAFRPFLPPAFVVGGHQLFGAKLRLRMWPNGAYLWFTFLWLCVGYRVDGSLTLRLSLSAGYLVDELGRNCFIQLTFRSTPNPTH